MEQMKGARTVGHESIYEDIQPSSDWTHDPKCHVLLVDLPGFKKEELKVRVDNTGKVTISGERQVSENKHQGFKQVFDMPADSDIDGISGRFDGGLLFIIIPKKKIEKIEPKHEIRPAPKNEIKDKKKDDEHKEEKKDDKHINEENLKTDHVKEQDNRAPVHSEKKPESERKVEQGRIKENETEKRGEEEATGEHGRQLQGIMNASGIYKKEKDWKKITEKVKNREEMEVMMRNAMENIKKNKAVIITAVVAFTVGAYISYKLK